NHVEGVVAGPRLAVDDLRLLDRLASDVVVALVGVTASGLGDVASGASVSVAHDGSLYLDSGSRKVEVVERVSQQRLVEPSADREDVARVAVRVQDVLASSGDSGEVDLVDVESRRGVHATGDRGAGRDGGLVVGALKFPGDGVGGLG